MTTPQIRVNTNQDSLSDGPPSAAFVAHYAETVREVLSQAYPGAAVTVEVGCVESSVGVSEELDGEHHQVEQLVKSAYERACGSFLRRWRVRDGDGVKVEIEATTEQAAADDYAKAFEPDDSTYWVDLWVQEVPDDDDDDESEESHYAIQIDPEPPACSADEHDWQSPHEVLGGLEENPGVQGHGGGVVIRRVCRHCGIYQVNDSWAQRPDDGSQGHDTTEYEEADERSLEWVESLEGDPPCAICQDPTDPTSHDGSKHCESGSIASGGTRSHCTCDRCF